MNWHVLQIAKAHFRYMISRGARFFTVYAWHLKSQQVGTQKNCETELLILSVLKLPLHGQIVFIDINTFILTEGWNFKKFLKENYAVALDNCYIFTKKV